MSLLNLPSKSAAPTPRVSSAAPPRLAPWFGGAGVGAATVLLLGLLAFAALNGRDAGCSWPTIGVKATAATYVYEKDDGPVPSGVNVGLSKLNEQGLVATQVDKNIVNGNGEIPKQYRLAIPAAQKAGLPSLVYHTDDKVLKIVKHPKTEADVLENKP